MGLEKILALPKIKNKEFCLASGLYLLTGLVDGLLTIQCLNLGNITDWSPLAQFFIDNYGIESGIILAKSNSLIAVAIGGTAERGNTPEFHKSLMRKSLYAGTALSELGIMAGLGTMYLFLR